MAYGTFLVVVSIFALVTGVSKGLLTPNGCLAFASILFVAFMEELAWGQMMFGWDTPENFRSLNAQGETTLHNIHGIHDLISPALLLFSSASAVFLEKKEPNIPWLKNNLWDFSKGLFLCSSWRPSYVLWLYLCPARNSWEGSIKISNGLNF